MAASYSSSPRYGHEYDFEDNDSFDLDEDQDFLDPLSDEGEWSHICDTENQDMTKNKRHNPKTSTDVHANFGQTRFRR